MKLHHIALAVADVDASAAWYQRHFDFKELHRYEKSNKTFCMIRCRDFQLELISSEETQTVATQATSLPRWMRHFCIAVEDVEKLQPELISAGVTIEKELTEAGFGGKYIFISDPDGHMIEVWSAN